ncbi:MULTISPECIES: acyl-CoA carboxylase epsilon subunit [unclassified Streptomyces]|uniref:acyl-CoA carboxylase epsilon subunit n=1 Tax=unclassified Streptomyces TaxID=2593676 RepID=UPI0040428741
MGDRDRVEPAVRVERGRADEAELAALTAVLLALRAAGRTKQGHEEPFRALRWWRRPEAYQAPHSWR